MVHILCVCVTGRLRPDSTTLSTENELRYLSGAWQYQVTPRHPSFARHTSGTHAHNTLSLMLLNEQLRGQAAGVASVPPKQGGGKGCMTPGVSGFPKQGRCVAQSGPQYRGTTKHAGRKYNEVLSMRLQLNTPHQIQTLDFGLLFGRSTAQALLSWGP